MRRGDRRQSQQAVDAADAAARLGGTAGEALLAASLAVLREAIALAGASRIAGIAISNQRETAIGWRRSDGQPIGPALTWQCARAADFCERLRHDRQAEVVRRATGLPLSPLFSAAKMRWLLDRCEGGNGWRRTEKFALAPSMPGCCGS